ncbi:cupredoxin domain-containing protein [Actinacidiphila paucisporea]|uniref:Plastocyanin n=1 Tax=Actinacidiphila paucisporea TaxID=310782 RepID=A0A1M7AIX9_9ACTN|nr:cupredoxin domain-containing protein [Actinacidiphila paucisporea]SHL42605.1 Plastocyanin [Actinacidiphila paucisporea]
MAGGAVRRRVGVLSAVGVLLALTGCSSSDSGVSGSTASASAPASSSAGGGADRIDIKNFAFNPASSTVAPGAVVTVTNSDSTTHTVTATGAKAFDTGDIAPGGTMTFTAPSKAGAYPYICSIHTFMKGTLTVG